MEFRQEISNRWGSPNHVISLAGSRLQCFKHLNQTRSGGGLLHWQPVLADQNDSWTETPD